MADVRLIDANALEGEAICLYSYGGARYIPLWALKKAPTIDPESLRPVGYWIHDVNNLYACSECLERETMSPKKKKPFCPNCGARMKGESDG